LLFFCGAIVALVEYRHIKTSLAGRDADIYNLKQVPVQVGIKAASINSVASDIEAFRQGTVGADAEGVRDGNSSAVVWAPGQRDVCRVGARQLREEQNKNNLC
jgi:hypothetical protein